MEWQKLICGFKQSVTIQGRIDTHIVNDLRASVPEKLKLRPVLFPE